MKLCTYYNEFQEVLGQIEATVQYNEQIAKVSNCCEREWPESIWERLAISDTSGLAENPLYSEVRHKRGTELPLSCF